MATYEYSVDWLGAGSGTADDPFIVKDRASMDVIQSSPGAYFVMVADVDMGETVWNGQFTFSGTFDGLGHSITGIRIDHSADSNGNTGFFGVLSGGIVRNVNLSTGAPHIIGPQSGNYIGMVCGALINGGIIENVRATGKISRPSGYAGTGKAGGLIGWLADDYAATKVGYVRACVSTVDLSAISGSYVGAYVGRYHSTGQLEGSVYSSELCGQSNSSTGSNTKNLTAAQLADPANYPPSFDFSNGVWEVVDNLPKLKARPLPGTLKEVVESKSAKVSGIVQLDGTPAQRTVRAFGYEPTVHDLDGDSVTLSKSLGHATSNPDTGEYSIDLLAGYDKRIFVVAFDDYGADFTPDMTVAVGDRVHPTTPNGHVFEATGAGTLPTEEPTWVVDTETSQTYGTAAMIAKPFYRPMVHGPVAPEVTLNAIPWTPAEAATALWLDADDADTLTKDGSDYILTWGDKSGANNSASQATAGKQPLHGSQTINGRPVVTFAGFDTWLDVGLALPAEFALYIVAQVNGTNSLIQTRQIGGATSGFAFYKGGSGLTLNSSDKFISTPTSDATTFVGHARATHNGAGSVSTNGGALVSDTPVILDANGVYLGRDSANNDRYLNGFIAEVVVLPEIPSQDTHQRLEGYLAHKWGTSDLLPQAHPYKDAAPIIEQNPTDEHYNSVALLLHMDGTAGSTTITDNGPDSRALTLTGDAAISDTDPKFSENLRFFGTGGELATTDTSDLLFGADDFTIELFVRPDVVNGDTVMSLLGVWSGLGTQKDRSYVLRITRGNIQFAISTDGDNQQNIFLDGSPVAEVWQHLAITRVGATFRLFIGGQTIATVTEAAALRASALDFAVGIEDGADFPFLGKMDELRITKGVARYTGDFTPPAAPFPNEGPAIQGDEFYSSVDLLLHMDSGALADSSGTPAGITINGGASYDPVEGKFGGALYMDGVNGSYISTDRTATIGTAAFTLEAFARPTEARVGRIISAQNNNTYQPVISIRTDADGTVTCFMRADGQTSATVIASGPGVVSMDGSTWHHIALTRDDAGVVRLFVGGVKRDEQTITLSPDGNNTWTIGAYDNDQEVFKGYIDEVRITPGVGRYTADFTPPAEPFPDSGA